MKLILPAVRKYCVFIPLKWFGNLKIKTKSSIDQREKMSHKELNMFT